MTRKKNPSQKDWPRALSASRFLARQYGQRRREFDAWLAQGRFEQAAPFEAPPVDAPDFAAALRRHRNAELVRIAFRDIAGRAALDETLAALSALAERCCRLALAQAETRLRERHGQPRDEAGRPVMPLVLGMGKLGGGELNFSSDIDLILAYTAAGGSDGARPLSNEEYFGRLAGEFTRLLAERSEDGFCYRVDWMLRPFGSAGPPAMSFAAMEEYYQTHGREWERYALIKARPVAGDRVAGRALLKSLQPFVYRRYLDFNAVGHLRDLKRQIDADAQRRGAGDDLKVGPGGIREIEFIVQSFQLMRGGREPRLRDARLRPVLAYLGEAGHLPAETCAALDAAYVLLRRTENAVQMHDDQQLHRLPEGEAERAALCAALGVADWAAFESRLAPARERARAEFARLFADAGPAVATPLQTALDSFWSGGAYEAPLPAAAQDALADLRDSAMARALSESAGQRLRGALAALLQDAAGLADGARAVARVLEVIAAITGRSTYLALLRDKAVAREHLLKLCAASPWLTRLLAQSPGLLDQLLDPRSLYNPPDRDELRAELDRLAAEVAPGDTEAAMNLLRRYVQETTLRIAAADLAGVLPLVKVSDRLTWLAEAAVGQALHFAQADLRQQYGEAPGLAIIAYGKFGGIELGYGSDLDLVFIHGSDTPEAETTGGRRRLSHAEYFARWTQRTINLLSAQTAAGRAYEVDLELRPSGNSGPPVSSLAGFGDYQREHAWTWEHQALTRARFVAGDAAVGARFEALRHEILRRSREPSKLRGEVIAMRERMRAQLDRSSKTLFDVKQGRGGITDLEFITQYLVLRDAHRAPALTVWSDNWRQLEALEVAGSIGGTQKETLIRVYRAYRAWVHVCSLQNQTPLAEDSLFSVEREAIRMLWRELLGEMT